MKVLHVTPTYLPDRGGISEVVHKLARTLQASCGFECAVAHLAPGLRGDHGRENELAVWRLPLKGNRLLGVAPGLAEVARNFDLLHVHDPQLMAITASVALFGAGRPAVLSTHGGFHHTRRHAWAKALHSGLLFRPALARYRRVLASSRTDAELFSRFSHRVELAENGVDVRKFSDVASRSQAPRDLCRWVYWGRMSRNKRLDLLIDLVARERMRGRPVSLLIVGEDFDGLRHDLEAQVGRLELKGAVRFDEAVDDGRLLERLADAGLFATASEYEGFGLTVIEAMSAGLAVLCRDMAPLNGFVRQGENGVLLAFDGSQDDEARVSALLDASPERLAALIRANRAVAESYGWEVAAPRYANVYNEVLGRDVGAVSA